MKCHYSYYIEKGKKRRVLLPGCMNAVHSNNINDCICQDPLTGLKFEKKIYNEVVNRLENEILELKKENKHLIDIIKRLK